MNKGKNGTRVEFTKNGIGGANSILDELGLGAEDANLGGDSTQTPDFKGDAALKQEFEKNQKIVADASEAILKVGKLAKGSDAEIKSIKEKAMPEFQKSLETIQEQFRAKELAHKKEIDELAAKFQKSLNSQGIEFEEQQKFAKSFKKFLVGGDAALSAEEKEHVARFSKSGEAVHNTEDGATGGFLVRQADFLRIIKEKAAISSLYNRCTTDMVTTKSVPIPIDEDSEVEAKGVSEREAVGVSTLTAKQIELTIKRFGLRFIYTQELIEGSLNPEERISRKVLEGFKRKNNRMILSGKGSDENEFLGILNNLQEAGKRGFHVAESTTANTVTLADLKHLWKVKHIAPYRENAGWIMSTDLLADLRFEEGKNGQFKWTTDIREGAPLLLNGQPVTEIYEMDDVATGGFPLIYGDLASAYQIIEYAKSYMIRDHISLSAKAEVIYTFFRFMDGKPTDTKALAVLKVR